MIPGQGNLMQRFPLTLLPDSSSPFSSTNMGCIPGRGSVGCAGLLWVTPARLEIRIPPVSVCHQVSTIGQRPLPTFSSNQCQASSLIGSPTEPSTFSELRSLSFTKSSPKPIRLRMAVGAVYRIFTLNLSTTSQKRPASGQVGIPSKITVVAPALRGP